MNRTFENLNQSNRFTYLWDRYKAGLRSIAQVPVNAALTALYGAFILAMLSWATHPAVNIFDRLIQPVTRFAIFLCAAILFVMCVTASAIPRGAARIADAFRRARVVNAAGEPPLPTLLRKLDGRAILEVFTQGIPLSVFQDKIEVLESALNRRITKIEQGKGKQIVRLYLAPGDATLPDRVHPPQDPPSDLTEPEILLGESLDGPVIWKPDKVPHLLIGGSTGSGKTTLVKSIISQFIPMVDTDGEPAAEVYVSDLKGGLDYPVRWRNRDCSFAVTAGDTLAVSSQIVQELNRRMDMFKQVSNCEGVPCSSLKDFNRLRPGSKLRRILFAIDEIAELTDTTGMDKPHKEEAAAIVGNLSTIARQGRALGIHLIVSTQRPDAVVVPGQIKNNLDGRICGKADNVLSQIILDKTDAADRIPKDSQGLFLDQDGILFRGCLFNDKTILPEGDTKPTL